MPADGTDVEVLARPELREHAMVTAKSTVLGRPMARTNRSRGWAHLLLTTSEGGLGKSALETAVASLARRHLSKPLRAK